MVCGLPRLLRSLAMTKGAKVDIHKLVIARTEGSWQSRYGIQLFIHRILFLFCFCIDFLWFMDCFVVSLLAMTRKSHHCKNQPTLSLREPKVRGNLGMVSPHSTKHLSLRDFTEVVAISVWQQPYQNHTIIVRITLATPGNI